MRRVINSNPCLAYLMRDNSSFNGSSRARACARTMET